MTDHTHDMVFGVAVGLTVVAAFATLLQLSGCEPLPPPDEPAPPAATCEQMCRRLADHGCKHGEPACYRFDAEGRCFERIDCAADCRGNRHAYPFPACVLTLPDEDLCAAVAEHCW